MSDEITLVLKFTKMYRNMNVMYLVDSPNKHCEVLLSCSDREIWNCMEMHASLWNCMEAWVTLGNLLETWNKADFHMGHYFDNQPLGKIYYKDKYASDYIVPP